MRKPNILIVMSLAITLLAVLAWSQTGTASAQGNQPVGVVVDYTPGQSISIVDQQGTRHEYIIASTVNLLPPNRASTLGVGSFVTIIAPASIDRDKQTAVGIVVHPAVPNGWTVPSLSPTPFATGTTDVTDTATPTGTLNLTETTTATAPETPTPIGTFTETATATVTGVETLTETPTATATPTGGGGATAPSNTLVAWLRSLFQQLLTSE